MNKLQKLFLKLSGYKIEEQVEEDPVEKYVNNIMFKIDRLNMENARYELLQASTQEGPSYSFNYYSELNVIKDMILKLIEYKQ